MRQAACAVGFSSNLLRIARESGAFHPRPKSRDAAANQRAPSRFGRYSAPHPASQRLRHRHRRSNLSPGLRRSRNIAANYGSARPAHRHSAVPVRLHVSGLTEIQAERKIQEVLESNGLVSHPEVTVTVKEKKNRPITVVGAVAHPMVYEADRQVRLIDVLAAAGGINGDAGDHVIITRLERDSSSDPSQDASSLAPSTLEQGADPALAQGAGPQVTDSPPSSSAPSGLSANSTDTQTPSTAQQSDPAPIATLGNTITISLNQILETGDMDNNIIILPGDVVTVPHAGIVYVFGAVSKPGGYTVSNDRAQLTTLKVLSLAGGLNRTAKSDRAVIVRKDSTGQQHEVEVDLKKVMKFQSEDVQLRPSDILYIPDSGGKAMAYRIAELSVAVGSGVLIYRLVQ